MPTEPILKIHSVVEQINWDSIYTAELPRVYNFFLYKVGDGGFAQDLTATTFERAWKLRSRYRPQTAAISTWLFGIARNVLKEHLRKSRSSGQKLLDVTTLEDVPAKVDIEKMYQREQEMEHLRKLLLELPDREQDLIALKYGAGLTNREMARITGLSETNVGSILFRTIKHIRARLEDSDGR